MTSQDENQFCLKSKIGLFSDRWKIKLSFQTNLTPHLSQKKIKHINQERRCQPLPIEPFSVHFYEPATILTLFFHLVPTPHYLTQLLMILCRFL